MNFTKMKVIIHKLYQFKPLERKKIVIKVNFALKQAIRPRRE